jgi:hypothetical protein
MFDQGEESQAMEMEELGLGASDGSQVAIVCCMGWSACQCEGIDHVRDGMGSRQPQQEYLK